MRSWLLSSRSPTGSAVTWIRCGSAPAARLRRVYEDHGGSALIADLRILGRLTTAESLPPEPVLVGGASRRLAVADTATPRGGSRTACSRQTTVGHAVLCVGLTYPVASRLGSSVVPSAPPPQHFSFCSVWMGSNSDDMAVSIVDRCRGPGKGCANAPGRGEDRALA